MSTRRTLFTLGGLVAAVALLAPAVALAQIPPLSVGISSTTPASFDKLKVTWKADVNTDGLTAGYRIYFRKQAADFDAEEADTAGSTVRSS